MENSSGLGIAMNRPTARGRADGGSLTQPRVCVRVFDCETRGRVKSRVYKEVPPSRPQKNESRRASAVQKTVTQAAHTARTHELAVRLYTCSACAHTHARPIIKSRPKRAAVRKRGESVEPLEIRAAALATKETLCVARRARCENFHALSDG